MRAFNNLRIQAQFPTEPLSSFNGIFLAVSIMLDPIFVKIIGHSALHSVAFGGVKVYVG